MSDVDTTDLTFVDLGPHKWATYREHNFRMERIDWTWRTYIREPNGQLIKWDRALSKPSPYTTNFQGLTKDRAIRKIKRWIDRKIVTVVKPPELWP